MPSAFDTCMTPTNFVRSLKSFSYSSISSSPASLIGTTQLCALLFGEHLPRHDVRVMLERRQDDFVAGFEELAPVAVHHEVDRLGRAAGEDDSRFFARIDEARILRRASS